MNSFLHLNRRLHLYLALLLSPWFLMYGISSIPFSHNTYFEQLDKSKNLPLWTQVAERTGYEMPAAEGTNLRPFADRIVKETGLEGAYGAYRPNDKQIIVYVHTFWKAAQVRCFPEEKRYVVERRRFRWDQFLTGMHAKGGFEHSGLHTLWSIVVDVTSVGMLLWVATGLLMWWKLPSTRRWGWIAIGSGVLSFALFMARL